ncbi:MAG: HD domain-containing protein [Chloroflexota bacterium]
MLFSVPTRGNAKLQRLLEIIDSDEVLQQLWRSVNVNAIDRAGINDHGEVHIRIVANAGLRLLRLLFEGDVEASVVLNYGLDRDDAELIVVLAACLHDLGMAIHRENHEHLSPILAAPILARYLPQLYAPREATILTSEVLHAVVAHHWDTQCLTVEAGVVKVADALDMARGRSRISFAAGRVSIHAVSAAAIDEVSLAKGVNKPVRIEVTMTNSAGIYQIDELLRRKLQNSSISNYVEVLAKVKGESEERLLGPYSF